MPIDIIDKLAIKNNPTNAIADANQIKGTWQSVANTAARDAIHSSARVTGMKVYTANDSKIWSLGGDLTTWTEDPVSPVSGGGGSSDYPIDTQDLPSILTPEGTNNWEQGQVDSWQFNSKVARSPFLSMCAGFVFFCWFEEIDSGDQVTNRLNLSMHLPNGDGTSSPTTIQSINANYTFITNIGGSQEITDFFVEKITPSYQNLVYRASVVTTAGVFLIDMNDSFILTPTVVPPYTIEHKYVGGSGTGGRFVTYESVSPTQTNFNNIVAYAFSTHYMWVTIPGQTSLAYYKSAVTTTFNDTHTITNNTVATGLADPTLAIHYSVDHGLIVSTSAGIFKIPVNDITLGTPVEIGSGITGITDLRVVDNDNTIVAIRPGEILSVDITSGAILKQTSISAIDSSSRIRPQSKKLGLFVVTRNDYQASVFDYKLNHVSIVNIGSSTSSINSYYDSNNNTAVEPITIKDMSISHDGHVTAVTEETKWAAPPNQAPDTPLYIEIRKFDYYTPVFVPASSVATFNRLALPYLYNFGPNPKATKFLTTTNLGTVIEAQGMCFKVFNKTSLNTFPTFFSKTDEEINGFSVDTSAAPQTINLNGVNYDGGSALVIWDKSGNAATNNITINLPGTGFGSINGQSSYVINNNYGAVLLVSNGNSWNIMSEYPGSGGSFTAGGDLSGTPTSQTVEAIKGTALATSVGTVGAPQDGHVLTWNNTNSEWEPAVGGGDVPYITQTVSFNALKYNKYAIAGGGSVTATLPVPGSLSGGETVTFATIDGTLTIDPNGGDIEEYNNPGSLTGAVPINIPNTYFVEYEFFAGVWQVTHSANRAPLPSLNLEATYVGAANYYTNIPSTGSNVPISPRQRHFIETSLSNPWASYNFLIQTPDFALASTPITIKDVGGFASSKPIVLTAISSSIEDLTTGTPVSEIHLNVDYCSIELVENNSTWWIVSRSKI